MPLEAPPRNAPSESPASSPQPQPATPSPSSQPRQLEADQPQPAAAAPQARRAAGTPAAAGPPQRPKAPPQQRQQMVAQQQPKQDGGIFRALSLTGLSDAEKQRAVDMQMGCFCCPTNVSLGQCIAGLWSGAAALPSAPTGRAATQAAARGGASAAEAVCHWVRPHPGPLPPASPCAASCCRVTSLEQAAHNSARYLVCCMPCLAGRL
jgi:hypothetical protein